MPSGYNALAARPQNRLAYPGQDVVNAFTQGLGPMLYGAAKGTAATIAGMPGDIEQLARQLLLSGAAPDSYTAKNMAAQALLPTSDRVRAMLPSLPGAGPQAQYSENMGATLGQNVVGNLVAPKALPAVAQMAGQGAAATGRFVAPKAGQLAEQYMVRTGGILPLDVYHGTPHTLPPTERNLLGEFDASKIGTGEGAQAYGHGIYVAEAPAVAKQYADNVKDMASITNMNAELSRLVKVMDADSAGGYRKFKSNVGETAAQQYDDLINKRNGVSTAKGNLYKVDLPDEKIAQMLDWDKPLSEQKNIIDALTPENMGLTLRPSVNGGYMAYLADGKPIGLQVKGVTPEVFRERWIDRLKEMGNLEGGAGRAVGYLGGTAPGDLPPLVSKALRQAGIPGIKYFDEMSRSAGEGTRNFVVFPGEEKSMTILERNGQPAQMSVADQIDNINEVLKKKRKK